MAFYSLNLNLRLFREKSLILKLTHELILKYFYC
jgi:hypothetical protein